VKEGSREVEQAIRQADRLFRAAVRKYRRAAPVICNARVARAAASFKEAGNTVKQAMRLLARPVCDRLELDAPHDVADSLCGVLHAFGTLSIFVGTTNPGMPAYVLQDLPDHDRCDGWLIHDSRAVLAEFARIGRLDLDSDEARRLRELIRVEFPFYLPEDEAAQPSRRTRRPRKVQR
jgi:hypothetical protein